MSKQVNDQAIRKVLVKTSSLNNEIAEGVIVAETKTLYKVKITKSFYDYIYQEGDIQAFKKDSMQAKKGGTGALVIL